MRSLAVATFLLLTLLASGASAGEWTNWRGPYGTGVSDEKGLVDSWSREGSHLIWRADFTGRSTPVVFDGRVCAIGRAGEDILRQEQVACWNADNGKLLWERRFNVYFTAVPWNRVGWADLTADAETGYVFAQGVNGRLLALDRNGETVWEWILGEDLGRFSGYGGRTNTPIVDEHRLIVHVIGAGFGSMSGGGDRYMAFDKRTGDLLWISPKGGPPKDLNTYATPILAVVNGQRLVITGGSDGWVRAFKARTGEEVWSFHLSQRGLNSSPVFWNDTVYISHSEENLDVGTMGRVVAIDATGNGDVTASHERWRIEDLQAGYASPAIADGVLYVPDNSANLHAIDAKSGQQLWELNYGTVGKGSPVLADGKIFLTEVNGNVRIARADKSKAEIIDEEHLEMPDGRYAEIYSSPAIAYGRLYFATEEGIYCIGDSAKAATSGATPERKDLIDEAAAAAAKVAVIRVVPAVVVGNADTTASFRVDAFDVKGRALGTRDATWTIDGIAGKVDANGNLSFDAAAIRGTQLGTVTAKVGELTASADLRIAGPLPWSEDFEALPVGKPPAAWLGTGKGAAVQENAADGKFLVQPKAARGAPRANILLGPSYLSSYTVQADARATQQGRRRADVGLTNSGYTFDLQGNHQRIQVTSWTSERRMMQRVPFTWEMDTWYTLKLRVDLVAGKSGGEVARIRGKVWQRGTDEPEAWTIDIEDPLPIRHGSPGLYTFAPVEAHFDNVKVFDNDR